MCRNIRPLFNYDPPATADDAGAAALQYIRKISGHTQPSAANKPAFDRAVKEVAEITLRLIADLETSARPRNREEELEKARARSQRRFG